MLTNIKMSSKEAMPSLEERITQSFNEKTVALPRLYRQGDMLLKSVLKGETTSIKRLLSLGDLNPIAENDIVVDGAHPHRLKNGLVIADYSERVRYILAEEGAKLVHEEHDDIDLMAGWYMLIQQREMKNLFYSVKKRRRASVRQIWD